MDEKELKEILDESLVDGKGVIIHKDNVKKIVEAFNTLNTHLGHALTRCDYWYEKYHELKKESNSL